MKDIYDCVKESKEIVRVFDYLIEFYEEEDDTIPRPVCSALLNALMSKLYDAQGLLDNAKELDKKLHESYEINSELEDTILDMQREQEAEKRALKYSEDCLTGKEILEALEKNKK